MIIVILNLSIYIENFEILIWLNIWIYEIVVNFIFFLIWNEFLYIFVWYFNNLLIIIRDFVKIMIVYDWWNFNVVVFEFVNVVVCE